MSVRVDVDVVDPGNRRYVQQAWKLKEYIREKRDVFHQKREFFFNAYINSTAYCLRDESEEELIGFASVRYDGYVLFLAVEPDYWGDGFGKRLIRMVDDRYDVTTCHVRSTNTQAIEFYNHLGFESVRFVNNYYEDGGDAHLLRLDSLED